VIIIETTTRERLVLVPEERIVCTEHARDATPDDLARAGYVLEAAGAEHIRAILVAAERPLLARVEKAERELSEVRELQRSDERDGNVGFSLTCWVESILEQLNIARINRTELGKAAGRYARERDEAKEFARVLEAERDTLLAELADAKAECQGAMLSAYAQYAETVRERDTARAELARLTAPAEGEPTDEALRDAFEVAYRDAASECHANAIRAIYRLGVAHERARQQPAQDRATDEELERVYSAAYARAWESEVSTPDRGERAGLRAVAAHVRQERCLVARVVSASMSMHVYRRGHDGWAVALGPRFVECEPADVPATLARLLGEVARG